MTKRKDTSAKRLTKNPVIAALWNGEVIKGQPSEQNLSILQLVPHALKSTLKHEHNLSRNYSKSPYTNDEPAANSYGDYFGRAVNNYLSEGYTEQNLEYANKKHSVYIRICSKGGHYGGAYQFKITYTKEWKEINFHFGLSYYGAAFELGQIKNQENNEKIETNIDKYAKFFAKNTSELFKKYATSEASFIEHILKKGYYENSNKCIRFEGYSYVSSEDESALEEGGELNIAFRNALNLTAIAFSKNGTAAFYELIEKYHKFKQIKCIPFKYSHNTRELNRRNFKSGIKIPSDDIDVETVIMLHVPSKTVHYYPIMHSNTRQQIKTYLKTIAEISEFLGTEFSAVRGGMYLEFAVSNDGQWLVGNSLHGVCETAIYSLRDEEGILYTDENYPEYILDFDAMNKEIYKKVFKTYTKAFRQKDADDYTAFVNAFKERLNSNYDKDISPIMRDRDRRWCLAKCGIVRSDYYIGYDYGIFESIDEGLNVILPNVLAKDLEFCPIRTKDGIKRFYRLVKNTLTNKESATKQFLSRLKARPEIAFKNLIEQGWEVKPPFRSGYYIEYKLDKLSFLSKFMLTGDFRFGISYDLDVKGKISSVSYSMGVADEYGNISSIRVNPHIASDLSICTGSGGKTTQMKNYFKKKDHFALIDTIKTILDSWNISDDHFRSSDWPKHISNTSIVKIERITWGEKGELKLVPVSDEDFRQYCYCYKNYIRKEQPHPDTHMFQTEQQNLVLTQTPSEDGTSTEYNLEIRTVEEDTVGV